MQRIAILLTLLLLSACVKSVPETHLYTDKDYVVKMIYSHPITCEYRGRAELTFVNSIEKMSASTILNKQCNSNIDIKFLGPFGMVMANASVIDGVHKVYKGGEDITNKVYFPLSESQLSILSSYLSSPPTLYDYSFKMYTHKNMYQFVGNGIKILVSDDYYIQSIVTDDYIVNYTWADGFIKTMSITVEDSTVTAKFYSGWIVK